MAVNYAPDDPVAGQSRASGTTEVQRWTDYADTIADVDSRITTLENGTSRLWIPAARFYATGGTPAMTTSLGVPAIRTGVLAYDASTDETAVATELIPTGWTAVAVDLWWTNLGAGSGNVVWQQADTRIGDGTSVTTETGRTSVDPAAPAQNVLKVTRLASGITVAAGEVLRLEISRLGSNAEADTLGNDAGLLGLILGKA